MADHAPTRTGSAEVPPTKPWRSGSIGLALWAGTATLSGLGESVQSFALTWEATGYGARAAALVATLGVLPRVVLLLVGGVTADRYGIRRVMICCDAAMIIILGVAVGRLLASPADLAVIIAVTVLDGIVSAFYLPASGGFLRLFVPDDRLPQMMARIGGLQQIARLVGPSLGAALVIMVALVGVTMINLLSYVGILIVLLLVRPPIELSASAPTDSGPSERSTTAAGQLIDGIGRAFRTPGMAPSLAALALVAGGVLPMLYLCLPLVVRERHWGVTAAGTIESCWIIGTMAVTLLIAKWGAYRRSGLMITLGALLAGGGIGVIAVASTVTVAAAGSVVMGIGTAIFTGHVSPLFLSWTPPELTARFQSLFGIVQAVPVLIMSPVYGQLTDLSGATTVLFTAAGIATGAALVVLCSRRLRSSTIPRPS